MGTGVPLLNEYKQDFFWKRVPQSTLGGPKFKLGYDAPVYVYVNQVLLFLIPWLIGGVFTALVELGLVECDTGIYIYGGLICVYVILVNFISEMIKSKEAPDISANTKAKNMLSEEEEIDFQTCCGTETVSFVVPGKKYKLNIVIHALISGPLCGLGFWYLLPKTLNDIYGNIVATTILYAFGWLTITIAQYSLTVGSPPETANFRTPDTWEITPLMRPFYCLVFFSFDVLAREFGEFKLVNEILHGVFVFLPVLWLLGVLPPLTALILWLGEQGLTILFGGSPMASDLRLLVMVVLSVCTYLAVNFIPHGLVTVALMSIFGYVLSLDLGGLGAQILSICCLAHPRLNKDSVKDRNNGFLWSWGVREFLYHTAMLVVIVTVAVVVNKYVASDDDQQLAEDLADYFAYAVMALLVIEVLLSEIQTVYILFGLWRNKLYPSSVQRTTIFRKGKSRLGILGYVRRIIMDWVSPFLMLAFLSLSVPFDKSSTDYGADKILGLHRAYRWIWQSTQNSMLEISIVKIISLTTDVSQWKDLGLGVQLLVVGFGRDRLTQILNKLYFYVMLLIWSWKDKKQRRKNSYLMITFNIIFFPLFLTVILFSAVVSAPLLPLFTLPLFLVGFPRPHRFWPAEVGASANVCDDTVYYGHMAPQLAKVFRDGFALGSLGEPSPGCHYLVRFQDRMAWIMVLERGYAYCAVSIKGLELQETSCHTIEAGRIDDIFEVTFEKENGVPCCSWHPHPLDTLRPYDAATIRTYSDAKNVLTGVIDSPEALQKVADGFVQCLIWVMLHHNYKRNKGSFRGNDEDDQKGKPKTRRSSKSMSNERPSSVKAWKRLSTNGSTPTMEESKTGNDGAFDEWESEIVFGETLDNGDIKKSGIDLPRPGTAESAEFKKRPQSAKSFSDSVWSDDSMIFESLDTKNTLKVNLVSGMAAHQKKNRSPESLTPVEDNLDHMPGVLGGDEPTKKRKNSGKKPNKSQQKYDDSIDDLSLFGDGDFGLPASDIHQKPPTRLPPLFGKPTAKEPVGSFAEITAQFSCHYSKVVSPPHIWTQIPMDPSTLEKYCEDFPINWYRHVLRCLNLVVEGDKPIDVTDQVADDKVLQKMYSKLVMACNAVVNILGLGGVDLLQMGTSHVFKMYVGDIPWSVASTWVTDDQELLDVVVKAYRYSVKLAIDQILLGDTSSNEELQEYMEEYDRDWYIGSEKDPRWRESVVHGKPTLFSLGHNAVDNTYNSRTLSIQDIPVYIGSLNAEVVRGQWANLGLELLYMTNDDEERYSIQAHPTILRNLTVQAADPPLGYPIYASPPVSIPTL